MKVGYDPNNPSYQLINFELPKHLSHKVLYDDWNHSRDKCGFYQEKFPPFVRKALKDVLN